MGDVKPISFLVLINSTDEAGSFYLLKRLWGRFPPAKAGLQVAKLRDVWEMPPRGGLHQVGVRGVIPAASLEGLGRICSGGSKEMPVFGEERGADGDWLVWHLGTSRLDDP